MITFKHFHLKVYRPFGISSGLLFFINNHTEQFILIYSVAIGFVNYADSFNRGWIFYIAWPQLVKTFAKFKSINLRYITKHGI